MTPEDLAWGPQQELGNWASTLSTRRGPDYPGSRLSGQPGKFAVAGHRTTYGAPFFNFDQIREGDEVVVGDRSGAAWTYRVIGQRIVDPW
ncbi:MAG: class E sortase [Egibacteraceae bacterium]